ncbi:calpain-type cysteine protease DEK1-like [Humulus lupulus]|uniref:calpain-type cysteine protease DEK1-like n=1 Tax=Humulus lupulus TaxID=3486 RepID=UPI002B405D6C|nr:calpain-type cysteine protease DEK1-like [Humulus lupulus]
MESQRADRSESDMRNHLSSAQSLHSDPHPDLHDHLNSQMRFTNAAVQARDDDDSFKLMGMRTGITVGVIWMVGEVKDRGHIAESDEVISDWMRPTDIEKESWLDARPCLFNGVVNPSDGGLGDCWFMSVVAVLTEVSQISEVIITPEYNDEGIYAVRFRIKGKWVPVVFYDWNPCESLGKPAFSTSRMGKELWVSLLEKAYAKFHGSYEALEGGLVQDALVDLTGGAGEDIDTYIHAVIHSIE